MLLPSTVAMSRAEMARPVASSLRSQFTTSVWTPLMICRAASVAASPWAMIMRDMERVRSPTTRSVSWRSCAMM